MTEELKELNDTFFKIFDDLNEARAVLTGEAYQDIAANILNEYQKEYTLLSLKCGAETDREIYRLEERYNQLVPRSWRRFFRRRENYAKTLMDIAISEEMTLFFHDYEKRIAESIEARIAMERAKGSEAQDEEWEIVEGQEPTEGGEQPQEAPQEPTEKGMKPAEGKAEEAPEKPPKKAKTKGKEKNAGNGNQT